MSTLSSANVTDVNLVLKERTHMRLCINMLIFTHNLGNWLIYDLFTYPINRIKLRFLTLGAFTLPLRVREWGCRIRSEDHNMCKMVSSRETVFFAQLAELIV